MRAWYSTQVAIIGAGSIGCSIAYQLALRGADVVVIEASGVGAGATTANLGLVWVQGKEPAEYMELNLQGAELHAELAPKFDMDIGLRQPGGLTICFDEDELRQQMESLARLKSGSAKYKARMVPPAELRTLEPSLSKDVVGAIYSPHDGHLDPSKLVFGLARLAKREGARFLTRTTARSILGAEGAVQGVETSGGFVRSEAVVVAAGTQSPGLVGPLGVRIPLRFDRGQILVTEQLNPRLNHPCDWIRQTEEGNILIGTTHENAGLDLSATVESAQKIARNALRCFPDLNDVSVIRQYAGIRPMPTDGKPYLGPVDRVRGLYVAVSHSGITLSHVHGKVISELILDGTTSVAIGAYRPERVTEKQQ